MSKNEAETRYELIDPVLRDKGYRVPYIKLDTRTPAEVIQSIEEQSKIVSKSLETLRALLQS